jgi:hypothetical protein
VAGDKRSCVRRDEDDRVALTKLDFKAHAYKYVVSDESGTDEIASLIGKEIGEPDLKWVRFPPADFKKVLLDFGFAEGAANDYIEMFTTLDIIPAPRLFRQLTGIVRISRRIARSCAHDWRHYQSVFRNAKTRSVGR